MTMQPLITQDDNIYGNAVDNQGEETEGELIIFEENN